MNVADLRRAFRARPGTPGCETFAAFLELLSPPCTGEAAWGALVRVLLADVIPVVARCHPRVELDEIESVCLAGAFESWIPEWREGLRCASQAEALLAVGLEDAAFAELQKHPRHRGDRAARARALWAEGAPHAAIGVTVGTQSPRGLFIARARAQIGEAERKQLRQSRLLTQHGFASAGLPAIGARQPAGTSATALHGAEPTGTADEDGGAWSISALPPAELLRPELCRRVRRMLGAIDALGPDHARVFKLMLEGLSQRSIAAVEDRHPAAISRRIRTIRELCRHELLA